MSSIDASQAAPAILEWLAARQRAVVELVAALARLESPTTEPAAQGPVFDLLSEALDPAGYRSRRVPGRRSGGQLLAVPRHRTRGRPLQLVLGHADTVWPLGTLSHMPVELRGGRLYGPGTFDMKAGLAMAVFAVRALREMKAVPEVTPVLFVSSDEETGSEDSRRRIEALARRVDRVWVLEPAYGPEGRIKTARKGVGEFVLTTTGKAAHAGLDPEAGVNAIVEMAHQIQRLAALNDASRGISVNVGMIQGGERTNVIAPRCTVRVDVRAPTTVDARRLEQTIRSLEPVLPGARLEVSGAVDRPPLEPTPANRSAWEAARRAGAMLGLRLEDAAVGGGSDGNFTSAFTSTLDGLGAVGDGAHADHEHIRVDALIPRTALLALLLLEPPLRGA